MISKGSVPSANDIALIVYDFDGVMTDNKVLTFQDGTEAVVTNRADGLGIDSFRAAGIKQMILSTETNPVVKARAAKLQLEVMCGCEDKKSFLLSYCQENGYDLNGTLYVGNDINDLEVMKIVGFPIAPADAHPEIKKIACFVTKAKGGDGVVKELAERIIGLKTT